MDQSLLPDQSPSAGLAQQLLRGLQTRNADEEYLGLTSKQHKTNLRALIDRADIGEPAASALPSDEDMKKLSAFARLGIWAPPIGSVTEIAPQANQRQLAAALQKYLQKSIGELLLSRVTPMGVINELFQAFNIGTDASLDPRSSLSLGIKYMTVIRDRMHQQSRAHPMPQHMADYAQELRMAEQVNASRSEDALAQAKRELNVSQKGPDTADQTSLAGTASGMPSKLAPGKVASSLTSVRFARARIARAKRAM